MAWSAGGLSYAVWAGFVGTGSPALTYGTASNQYIALFNNSITPNYHDTLANSAYNAGQWASGSNECSGTNWSAGGVVMTTGTVTTAVTDTGSVLKYTASAALSVSTVTLTSGTYGALIYMNSLSPKYALVAVPFPSAPFQPTAGTFSITWNASGIVTWSIG